jgi:hypothetical protein
LRYLHKLPELRLVIWLAVSVLKKCWLVALSAQGFVAVVPVPCRNLAPSR